MDEAYGEIRKEKPYMSEPLAVGSRAPAFEATASDGKTYRLTDLLHSGSVALVFYPGNNTPG
jgi:peroxiredoxin